MTKPSALAVLLLPVFALSAAAAPHFQDAPRLDGSNVPQSAATSAAPPATTQAAPPPATQPAAKSTQSSARSKRGKKPDPATAPVVLAPPPPPTPADMPPVAASVFFSDGLLTIHAHNASLSQILHDTSTQTGMELQGTPEDQRIFGDYGPGPVRIVLGQLLDGGPSNYVLFGKSANLAPRTLVITPKSSLAPGQVAGVARPAVTVNTDADDDDDTPPVNNAQPGIRPLMPNRGGVGGDQSGGNPNVRTPQQIIDDMQRRRQEQQGQQPPAADTQ